MARDVLAVINSSFDTFSKGQRRIAKYILENYDKEPSSQPAGLERRQG